MNDSYKELLVRREKSTKDTLLRVVSIIPTVLIGFLTLLTGNILFFIVAVAFGVLDYFVFQWTDIEYEYLYLDKEISIDKIMAKTRRKRVLTIDVNKIEILAPENSYQLDSYRNRQVKKISHKSSATPNAVQLQPKSSMVKLSVVLPMIR